MSYKIVLQNLWLHLSSHIPWITVEYIYLRFSSHEHFSLIIYWQICLQCTIDCLNACFTFSERLCIYLTHLYTLSSSQIQLEISFTSMGFSLFPFFYNTSEKSTRAQQCRIGIHKHMYLVKIRKQASKSIQKETKRQGYPWIKLQLLSVVLANTFLEYEYLPLFQDQLKLFSSALKAAWYYI